MATFKELLVDRMLHPQSVVNWSPDNDPKTIELCNRMKGFIKCRDGTFCGRWLLYTSSTVEEAVRFFMTLSLGEIEYFFTYVIRGNYVWVDKLSGDTIETDKNANRSNTWTHAEFCRIWKACYDNGLGSYFIPVILSMVGLSYGTGYWFHKCLNVDDEELLRAFSIKKEKYPDNLVVSGSELLYYIKHKTVPNTAIFKVLFDLAKISKSELLELYKIAPKEYVSYMNEKLRGNPLINIIIPDASAPNNKTGMALYMSQYECTDAPVGWAITRIMIDGEYVTTNTLVDDPQEKAKAFEISRRASKALGLRQMVQEITDGSLISQIFYRQPSCA